MNEVDITGLDKARLLAALYGGARAQGMGFLQYVPGPMSIDEAREHIAACFGGRLKFDYLKGRVLKVNITGDTMNTALYNRDNGDGFAEYIVQQLRESGE